MKTLNHKGLFDAIASSSGAIPVGIEALTDARARKTGNPFKTIEKLVRAVGFVGADYEDGVRREGKRQGATEAKDFEADKLPWGEWSVPNKVIAHKGEYYLRTQTTPGMRRKQPAKVLKYIADGQTVGKEAIASFLPTPSVSEKQLEVGVGEYAGAKGQVWVRTYAFRSLRKVRLNGHTYKVSN